MSCLPKNGVVVHYMRTVRKKFQRGQALFVDQSIWLNDVITQVLAGLRQVSPL